MPDLHVTEFAGPGPALWNLTASQVVAIAGAHAESDPLANTTRMVRLFAESDCTVAIGLAADAEAGPSFPMAADTDIVIAVHERSGFVVSVVERPISE